MDHSSSICRWKGLGVERSGVSRAIVTVDLSQMLRNLRRRDLGYGARNNLKICCALKWAIPAICPYAADEVLSGASLDLRVKSSPKWRVPEQTGDRSISGQGVAGSKFALYRTQFPNRSRTKTTCAAGLNDGSPPKLRVGYDRNRDASGMAKRLSHSVENHPAQIGAGNAFLCHVSTPG